MLSDVLKSATWLRKGRKQTAPHLLILIWLLWRNKKGVCVMLPCECVRVCVCTRAPSPLLVHLQLRLNWANSERGFRVFHAVRDYASGTCAEYVWKSGSAGAAGSSCQFSPLSGSRHWKCPCVFIFVCVCGAAMLHVTAASCWVAEAPLFSRLAAGFCLGAAALPVAAHWA